MPNRFTTTLGPDEATILWHLWDLHPSGLDLEEAAELTNPSSKRLASIALGNLTAIGAAERDSLRVYRATASGRALIDQAHQQSP